MQLRNRFFFGDGLNVSEILLLYYLLFYYYKHYVNGLIIWKSKDKK